MPFSSLPGSPLNVLENWLVTPIRWWRKTRLRNRDTPFQAALLGSRFCLHADAPPTSAAQCLDSTLVNELIVGLETAAADPRVGAIVPTGSARLCRADLLFRGSSSSSSAMPQRGILWS